MYISMYERIRYYILVLSAYLVRTFYDLEQESRRQQKKNRKTRKEKKGRSKKKRRIEKNAKRRHKSFRYGGGEDKQEMRREKQTEQQWFALYNQQKIGREFDSRRLRSKLSFSSSSMLETFTKRFRLPAGAGDSQSLSKFGFTSFQSLEAPTMSIAP